MKGMATSLKQGGGTIVTSSGPTPVAVKMLKEDAGQLELEDLIKVRGIKHLSRFF